MIWKQVKKIIQNRVLIVAIAVLTISISACGMPSTQAGDIAPQGLRDIAQQRLRDRTFLDISLEFLGEYQLPANITFQDTPVGGLSGITYDRRRDRFYAVSDDASRLAPARFYTLNLILNHTNPDRITIQNVEVENVTFLKDKQGNTFPQDTIDAEGIALTPQQSVFIANEGVASNRIPPSVEEFDLLTGQQRQSLPVPERYLPDATGQKQQRGIQNNLGFESLTLNPTGTVPASGEPFRLFTATESALVQDRDPVESDRTSTLQASAKCRFLHYLLSDGPPILISEHLYQLEPPLFGVIKQGLAELLALDAGGHFLSLERSAGLAGFGAQIYQLATGGATDISSLPSLINAGGVEPIKKQLLFDLQELSTYIDNLEGMTLGPRLPDGSQSLLLVSDNNFNNAQITQFLLFRLKENDLRA